MPKKAVFSDLDGTLSKGFITVDFVRWLGKKGLLAEKAFGLHEALMQEYKEGKIKYLVLVPKWSQSVADCFAGIEEERLKQLAEEFFEEWKHNSLYSSTKQLVALLQAHDYKFFLISAGWDYLVELTKKEINADGAMGMKIKTLNGCYIAELGNELFNEKGKKEEISKILLEKGIGKNKTMGFGDSLQDSAIFESVKKPVALNPSPELLEKAKKENWYIANKDNILQVMQECFEKGKPPKIYN